MNTEHVISEISLFEINYLLQSHNFFYSLKKGSLIIVNYKRKSNCINTLSIIFFCCTNDCNIVIRKKNIQNIQILRLLTRLHITLQEKGTVHETGPTFSYKETTLGVFIYGYSCNLLLPSVTEHHTQGLKFLFHI